MADLARIKNNVRKMAAQGAPEADIDGYIASEGVTLDDVRNFKAEQPTEERGVLRRVDALGEQLAIRRRVAFQKIDPVYRFCAISYRRSAMWHICNKKIDPLCVKITLFF